MNKILHHIRNLKARQALRCQSDGELLERFVQCRDDAAFAALVERHGGMALAVCRRVLRNGHDAEDACQAAFLVLARKANSIQKKDSIGSWLHGVAYRVAANLKRQQARNKVCRQDVENLPDGDTFSEVSWREAQALLDQELDRLPEHFRAPLVLCYLEGKTRDEAAQELGWSLATLRGRLERGRKLLRDRLARRGLTLSGVILGTILAEQTARALMPAALKSATVEAAALTAQGQILTSAVVSTRVISLMEGVLSAMFMTQLKRLAFLLIPLLILSLGSVGLLRQSSAVAGRPQQAGQATSTTQKQAANAQPAQQKKENISDVVDRVFAQLKKHPVRPLPGRDQLSLFAMDLGSRETILIAADVDNERAYCGSPCWSSDGRRIFFDASPGQQFNKTRVQMLEITDKTVGLSSFGPGNCPTVSPDGKEVAFILNPGSLPGADPGLYVMKADGSDRRLLARNGCVPKWSPDGGQLLIFSFTSPHELALVDVATKKIQPVQFPGYFISTWPSWVSDDTIVTTVRSAKEVAIALVDVSNPAEAKVKEVLWKRDTDYEPIYPVYSPKTRRCVFVGRNKDGQTLYAFEPGRQPQRLEPNRYDGKIASLTLSPDGRYLLFASDRQ